MECQTMCDLVGNRPHQVGIGHRLVWREIVLAPDIVNDPRHLPPHSFLLRFAQNRRELALGPSSLEHGMLKPGHVEVKF